MIQQGPENERVLFSGLEKSVLLRFSQYLMTPGKMLCFSGPDLARHRRALQALAERKFLEKEDFKGGYSLTQAGFRTMALLVQEISLKSVLKGDRRP